MGIHVSHFHKDADKAPEVSKELGGDFGWFCEVRRFAKLFLARNDDGRIIGYATYSVIYKLSGKEALLTDLSVLVEEPAVQEAVRSALMNAMRKNARKDDHVSDISVGK